MECNQRAMLRRLRRIIKQQLQRSGLTADQREIDAAVARLGAQR